ncbi:PBSX family phage terminase large subunit [Mucilaginibacter sp. KACC 22063]|uniref:PBSX family phage terminase large subunit n=1 Tax=Mucilaginibacter sp. KACC 22063 TaxID=3025666 RepID=UPI002365C515|nr:terminase large subunit [Mucilaginibacter sp. KACC 22063]WDF54650.1 terminase large subunit [Mucilaginibacter sp. KACC 22063]
MFKTSALFRENYHSPAHIIVNQGGSSSGKTYAIMQVLFCIACEQEKQIITVVGQDIPNIKAGVLRDALNIYHQSTELQQHIKNYNKTDRIFEFYNGSIIEFKSYGNAQDAKSGKRQYLFVNEANGISWDIYTELSLRTSKKIFVDYNPNSSFWIHEYLIGQQGVQQIISDHRHNPFIDEVMHHKIERLKLIDLDLWKVYARGLTGKLTGLVFTNWQPCDSIPADAKKIAYGLDFGFTNDETGCIELYMQNGELWLNELIYETGLTNQDISAKLKQLNVSTTTEIIADSAEPKSIEELRRLGWRMVPAIKGPDSIKNSIDILKRYKLNITQSSINLRKELMHYQWKTDNNGKALNEPIDAWNHLIDPLRYIALLKLRINNIKKPKSFLPWQQQNQWHNDASKLL